MRTELRKWVSLVVAGLMVMQVRCDIFDGEEEPEVGDITGTVIDSITEEKLPGVAVSTEPSTKSVQTNNQGEFTISGVPAGEYVVKYHKDGYTDDQQKILVQKKEAAHADFQLRPLKGIIYGRITDAKTARAIADVSITATPEIGSLTSDEDGNYRTDRIAIGSYMVTFKAAGYRDASMNVDLESGEQEQMNVQLEPSRPPVIGALKASSNRIKKGESVVIIVEAHDPGGGPLSCSWSKTGGAFSSYEGTSVTWTAPQEPGTYTITVTVRDENGSTAQKSIEIRVIPDTTISGMVIDASTDGSIVKATVWTEPNTEQVFTNDDGAYTIRANIELERRYRVTASKAGYISNSAYIVVKEGENRLADIRLSPGSEKLVLHVSPRALDFGTTSATKTLDIRNTGTGTLRWRCTLTKDWIRVAPDTGSVTTGTETVVVTVAREGLSPGSYNGGLEVLSAGGGDVTVPVAMGVPDTASPALRASETTLDFGSEATSLQFSITNAGTGVLQWSAYCDANWITIDPPRSHVATGTEQVTVSIDRSGLDLGIHTGDIAVSSNGGSTVIALRLRVNAPPNEPANPFPADGRTGVSVRPSLTWTGGDPDPDDRVTYDLYLGTNPNPPKGQTGLTQTRYVPGLDLMFNAIYYWQVIARDNHGDETAGPVWRFTTGSEPNSAPNTPANPSPANGTVGVSPVSLKLTWRCDDPDAGDVLIYDVYFGMEANPPLIQPNHSMASYETDNLQYGTTYYWKVVAKDNHASTIDGPVWSFTTSQRANNPPNMPTNPYPSDQAKNISITPVLRWVGGDLDPDDVVTYTVYFGQASNPPQKESYYTKTAYTPGALDYLTTYYWKIVASDDRGEVISGPVWRFTTMERPNNPPNTPSQPSPANEATNVLRTETLRWKGGDPDAVYRDQARYDVYFGTDASPSLVKSDLSATRHNPGTLHYGTKYYWKVVAKDKRGGVKEGPVWHFTVEANKPPDAPKSPSPANKARDVARSVALRWSCNDPNGDPLTYDLYFGTDHANLPVIQSNVGTTRYTLLMDLQYSTAYYWKVKAKDTYGNATEGPVWYFTTEAADTEKPTVVITSPRDGTTVRGLVQVRATASDNVRVTRVEFYVDYERVGMDSEEPYVYDWDTSGEADGSPHTLMAKAYDAIGNVTGSAVVNVSVDNSVVPVAETITAVLPGGATMEMVWIEPGTFMMGSPDGDPYQEDNECPQHKVTISHGFYLGKYEITRTQWRSVMGTRPWIGQDYVRDRPNEDGWLAATYISWYDIQKFITELNETEGAKVYRLPTEAEREYACRAGTNTSWSFGDNPESLGDFAWWKGNTWDYNAWYLVRNALRVGMKYPDAWGLYDMHGGVCEWTQDYWGLYSNNPQVDPTGPTSGSYRVARGGGFFSLARDVRSAKRYGYVPEFYQFDIGARLLRQDLGWPADTEEPTVEITYPRDGTTARGVVQVRATASDNVRVTRVEFYVNYHLVATDNAEPYAYAWDTRDEVDGSQHTLMTKAYDAMGNVTGSGVVNVTVDNSAPPVGENITVLLPGGATMEMVWIEPGTFMMGSPLSEGGFSEEDPQHKVTISRWFYLGKYEITQGQWESVMETRPWAGKSYVRDNPNYPAVYISWDDVQAFIAKLNTAEEAEVYRLPTEAEWEYACRAGTNTRWSFGEDESQLGKYAWYEDNTWGVGEGYAHAVGLKLPNPWGLYDMHGNVFEWVQDWYGLYSSEAQVDPTGPSTGSSRVLRSGYFQYSLHPVRSAIRHHNLPGIPFTDVGARLLRQSL